MVRDDVATCGPALQQHCCFCRTNACAGKAALRQTRSPRRIVPRHRCGQPRSPVRPTAPLISHNDRSGAAPVAMWLSTTGSSALGQPSTNTARSEDSFRHPPTHRDYRRIRRPTRALPSRLLGGTRSPRSRTKSRVDFAALRVPKHTIKKHAPRETTNVPTPPSPSEELLEKYKSRHEERPWAQPPTPKARPKPPVAPTPPPPPPPSPYSPNTKKSLLTVVK